MRALLLFAPKFMLTVTAILIAGWAAHVVGRWIAPVQDDPLRVRIASAWPPLIAFVLVFFTALSALLAPRWVASLFLM